MPIPTYAARRDKNEREIISALADAGATVYQSGEPLDLIVGFRGRNYLIEVKTPDGKLTSKQRKWWALDWAGQRVIVRSVQEALVAIGAPEQVRNVVTDYELEP